MRGQSSPPRLCSAADGYAAPIVAEDLLQLQRIVCGFLIRRQCEQRFERQEKPLDLHKGVLLRTPVLPPSATPVKEGVVVDGFAVGGTAAVLSINTDQRSTSSYETSDRIHFTAPMLPTTSPRCQSSAPALWGSREPAVHPRVQLRARGVPRCLAVVMTFAPAHPESCGRLSKHEHPRTASLLVLRYGEVERKPGPRLRCVPWG
ncbi:LOW QUALITY PROTEIN: hypothetical protein Q4I31_005912 [Leishmania lindenbergi]|uniref:Uncharacterized protein n=1 Tax=Leishmania lindenbergi TaxID=651832 RepID=A0AAW3A4W7_9TRYP